MAEERGRAVVVDWSQIATERTTWLAAGLLLLGLAMVIWHWQSWRSAERGAQRTELAPAEYQFAWRQHRRRTQISAMIVSLAVFIFCSIFIRNPLLVIFYWLGVLMMLLWIVLLALGDMLASRHHFGQIRRKNLAEQARLTAELRRLIRQAGDEPDVRHDADSES